MDTPKVNFNVVNTTTAVSSPVNGVTYFRGKTIRGPFDKPDEIINSWPAFKRRYGGLTGDIGTVDIKRYFDKGGKARFSRMGHYTTITDRSSLTATKAAPDAYFLNETEGEGIKLFSLPLKYEGADYNNIVITTELGSNGIVGYFNLNIYHLLDPSLTERYENLIIPGNPTVAESNYLKKVVDGSELVDVIYEDLSLLTPGQVIIKGVDDLKINHTGGTDGGVITVSDIIGDSASRTGFNSFDEVDDSYQLVVLGTGVTAAVHNAGHAYALGRQDLQYWAFPDTSINNKAGLIAFREATGMNTKYGSIFAGGIKILDPLSSQKIESAAAGDVPALAVNSEVNFGIAYSFAGNTRGLLSNVLGVVNNFGTPGSKADLNELANRQINCIINRDGLIKLWGGFSTQITSDSESFNSVVRLVMYIKKSLRPNLESFLEEPTDIPTFYRLYHVVKPFFETLVNKRALSSWEWQGDQFASSPADFQINKQSDVALGKYKIRLILVPIVGMQEITLDMFITSDGEVSIEQS